MKFGKTLLANQIPEWSRNYICYKSLKMAIKASSTKLPAPEEDITGSSYGTIIIHISYINQSIKPSFSNWTESLKKSIPSLYISKR